MQLRSFFYLIVLGYIGVKIVLGLLFKMYPEKYYTKNIIIQTNEPVNPFIIKHNNRDYIQKQNLYMVGPKTKKVVEKGLMPNMLNMEIMDFITTLVFTFVIFVFGYQGISTMIKGEKYTFDNFVVIGYIIGLSFPVFQKNLRDSLKNETPEPSYNNNYLILVISYFILIIGFTLFNSKIDVVDKVNYVCYVMIIALIYYGIVKTKKTVVKYDTTTEVYNTESQCSNDIKGRLKSSFDSINITIPMTAWILLLLFIYSPSNSLVQMIYFFLFGLLLGIFVSGVSFNGLEYVLTKIPEQICQGKDCLENKIDFQENMEIKIEENKPSETRKMFKSYL